MKFFLPLKPLNYEILSHKREKDVYLSLKNETANDFDVFSECPFYGSVSENSFEISLNTGKRNTMKPKINGSFSEKSEKTLINITVPCEIGVVIFILQLFAILHLITAIPVFFTQNISAGMDSLLEGLIFNIILQMLVQFGFYKPLKVTLKKLKEIVT